jgi:hypothetical protein
MDALFLTIIVVALIIFLISLVFDFARIGANAFLDKWVGKTAKIWLPFHALKRLIKEVILKEDK